MGFSLRAGKASSGQRSLFGGAKPAKAQAVAVKLQGMGIEGALRGHRPFQADLHPRDFMGQWRVKPGAKKAAPKAEALAEHGYLGGYKVKFTGNTVNLHGGEFHEVKMLEGPDKGQIRVAKHRPPAAPAPKAEAFTLRTDRKPSPAKFEATGAGKTHFMFDMKKGDPPGQTSLLDRVPSVPTHPKGPSLREQADKYRAGKGTREKRLDVLGQRLEMAYGGKHVSMANSNSIPLRTSLLQEYYRQRAPQRQTRREAAAKAAETKAIKKKAALYTGSPVSEIGIVRYSMRPGTPEATLARVSIPKTSSRKAGEVVARIKRARPK